MLVAVCDQFFGTSTSSWRKMVTPFSLPISAVRFSHSTASNGEILPSVKRRSNFNPAAVMSALVSADLPCMTGFTVAAILFLQRRGPLLRCGGTLIFYSFASAKVLRLLSYCFELAYDSVGPVEALGFSSFQHKKKRPLLPRRPPNVNKPPSTVFLKLAEQHAR